MSSRIVLFYLSSSIAFGVADITRAAEGRQASPAAIAATPGDADPDALYRQREDLSRARRAADIWRARRSATPGDFEAAWKLARAFYWLGGHGPESARRLDLEAGIEAAAAAITAAPTRPEGYFWSAANMGALAESFGLRQGIKYRKPIKENLERVLAIDPAFQHGSADRALGRWYFKVPRLFGGSKEKSAEHLRKSLSYNPTSTASLYFLAETLLGLDDVAEARRTLQACLDAPLEPEWVPEDREFKTKARALLATLPAPTAGR